MEACKRLDVKYETFDDNHNFIRVNLDKPYLFLNFSTPFNNDSVVKLCVDKEFTYRLLKEKVHMPRTAAFFDPHYEKEDFQKYKEQKDEEAIADCIVKDFNLPVIVKMNQGSFGTNVFLCRDRAEVLQSLKTIYNKKSSDYDYMALAQEYIDSKKEYRAIIFQGEVILLYEKNFSQAVFTGNLSPLHQENARAELIEDQKLIERISDFIRPMFEMADIEFAGLDILIDKNDDIFLLEINSKPGFSYFVRDNGEEPLVEMYEKLLVYLKNK